MNFQILRDGIVIHEVEVNRHSDTIKLSMVVSTPDKPIEFEYIESKDVLSVFQTNQQN